MMRMGCVCVCVCVCVWWTDDWVGLRVLTQFAITLGTCLLGFDLDHGGR